MFDCKLNFYPIATIVLDGIQSVRVSNVKSHILTHVNIVGTHTRAFSYGFDKKKTSLFDLFILGANNISFKQLVPRRDYDHFAY